MRAAVAAASAVLALAAAAGAQASPSLELGIMDEEHTLWASDSDPGFDTLAALRAQVVKASLYWRSVARRRPAHAADPADPAYDWSEYDRLAVRAESRGLRLLLAFLGTPGWANAGKGWRYAPMRAADLQAFAQAAARRYSGRFALADGRVLPRVDTWTVWNEPNLATFLRPQWRGRAASSPAAYARLCTAVWTGVHAAGAGETVACGETAPRGNDDPSLPSASVSPLVFLRGLAAAGARFDVYSHHPNSLRQAPARRPPSSRMVSLGNIDLLVRELDRLYPGRPRLWITEYGYRTNPPDRLLGVPWRTQATYLAQAWALARRNPRIDLFVWFQLRDERRRGGWASGLLTAGGKKKPSYWIYANLPR